MIAGLVGIAIAWAIYSEKRIKIPAAPFWQRTLEHKFYFDELYDAVFYRPAVALANGLRREIEEPVILQTGYRLGEATLRPAASSAASRPACCAPTSSSSPAAPLTVVLAFLIAK